MGRCRWRCWQADFLAPIAGRLADRYGAGRLLAFGSFSAALTLAATSLAPNGVAFVAGLIAVELASAFVFYAMSFTALVQFGGRGAQRSITHLTLIAGFASTLFWPLTDLLHQHLGWREVYQAFAAANLLICLPLHAWIARLGTRSREALAAAAAVAPQVPPEPPTGVRGAVFGLMIMGFLLEGFVLSAILVHMVPMLDALSLSTTAIFVTTLFGPAQVLSRFTNLIFGRTLRQANLAIIAAGLLSAGLVVLLLTLPWLAGAMAFAILFGFGSGLTSIIGGTLPLELFGQAGYGSRTGWINVGAAGFVGHRSLHLLAAAGGPGRAHGDLDHRRARLPGDRRLRGDVGHGGSGEDGDGVAPLARVGAGLSPEAEIVARRSLSKCSMRVAQRDARHGRRVLVEEGRRGGAGLVGGGPEHAADRLVDEVLRIVQQELGDRDGVVELPRRMKAKVARMAVRRSHMFFDFASLWRTSRGLSAR